MPRTTVRINPEGLLGPGTRNRAIMPAMKPIRMIHRMPMPDSPLQVSTKRVRLDQARCFTFVWNAPVRGELVDQLGQLLAQTCDQLVARHSGVSGERSDLIWA